MASFSTSPATPLSLPLPAGLPCLCAVAVLESGAMGLAAKNLKLQLPKQTSIDATVQLSKDLQLAVQCDIKSHSLTHTPQNTARRRTTQQHETEKRSRCTAHTTARCCRELTVHVCMSVCAHFWRGVSLE